MQTYRQRLVDSRLDRLFGQLPAVSIVGPRACGKTTTARRLVANLARLDQPDVAALFRHNPDAALKGYGEPLLLDEWQEVPEILGAVKRAVDDGTGPGRFLLTGSASAAVTTKQWPGTGRVFDLPMWTLSEREVEGRIGKPGFLDRLRDNNEALLSGPSESPRLGLLDYVDKLLRGGFPEPVFTLDSAGQPTWLDGYVSRLLGRDPQLLGTALDPRKFSRFVETLALNTAGIVDDISLLEAAGVDRKTAARYEGLLTSLYLLDSVPAWWSNRMTRLVKMPKRMLIDPSLVAVVLRLDRSGLIRDPSLLGRMIETFVFTQLRPEVDLSEARPRLYHLRDQGGRHEVDIIVEYGASKVAGIEVKTASSVDRSDAKHLEWLRDKLGDRFLAGVVLHTGPMPYRLSERIIAAPISTIWA